MRFFYRVIFVVLLHCIINPLPTQAGSVTGKDFTAYVLGKIEEFKVKAKPIVDRIAEKSTLEYGDSCSVSTEEKRGEISERQIKLLPKFLQDFNFTRYFSEVLNLYDEASWLPGKLCNWVESRLGCSLDGNCTCGDAGYIGLNLWTQRENNSCVLGEGSICYQPEPSLVGKKLREALGQPSFPKCSSDTQCIVKRTGEICSLASYNVEIGRLAEKLEPQPDRGALLAKKAYQEGICVCGQLLDKP